MLIGKTSKLAAALSISFQLIQFAAAQGTAFTYQGRLNDGGTPAAGIYDLRFAAFDAATAGNAVSGTLANSAVAITNGLFTVQLDFGPGIFPGAARWLEISVRTNGTGTFVTLAPRQLLAATPYAITAGNVTGPLPASQLTGTLPSSVFAGAVLFTNPANTFSGNGGGLTNLQGRNVSGVQTVINVKDFGAKGDGTNDDWPAIQAAFDAAKGGTASNPKTVFLPYQGGMVPPYTSSNGAYWVTKTLTITNPNTVVCGESFGYQTGSFIRSGASIGILLAKTNGYCSPNQCVIKNLFIGSGNFNGVTYGTGTNIYIQGGIADTKIETCVLMQNDLGIYADGPYGLNLQNVDFWHCNRSFLTAANNGRAIATTIRNCTFDEDQSGLWLSDGNYLIEACKFGLNSELNSTNCIVTLGNTVVNLLGCTLDQGRGSVMIDASTAGNTQLTLIGNTFSDTQGGNQIWPVLLGANATVFAAQNSFIYLNATETNYFVFKSTAATNKCFVLPTAPAALAADGVNRTYFFSISFH